MKQMKTNPKEIYESPTVSDIKPVVAIKGSHEGSDDIDMED